MGRDRRRIRTGIALSASEIVAADLRLRSTDGAPWRMALEPPGENGGGWTSLANALAELARALGVTGGQLSVALMPPLTEVRRLELPPMSDEDIERLLSRNAGKYFVTARAPQLVGAVTARRVRGKPVSSVAAAAPAMLVAKIHAAARDTGWTVDEIGPAESAWAAAAVSLWPGFASRQAHVLVAHDDRTDVLTLDDGRLAGVRRFRGGAAEASLVADAIRDAGGAARVGAFGRRAMRQELARALNERRITVDAPTGSWADLADAPEALAAHFAGAQSGPVLRSAEARATDRQAAHKVTMLVLAAAVLLVVLAGALEMWGVKREIGIVQAERAKIRPQIASTFVGRTTIEAAYGHLATLSAAERGSPRWSAVITALAAALPDDAHLIGARMRGDSLVVDGFAPHAARVFDALERMPQLTNVRAAAPVRREVQEDKTAFEHFLIAAIVRSDSPATSAKRTADATPAKVGQ